MSEERTARRFLITGRVQGVGFRYFVENEAVRLGLDGYVRNLADGKVEVYAVGPQQALNELSGLLRRGPARAEVRHVQESEAPVQILQGFGIRS